MKIVIDGRLYGLENAGLGRYVMNLVNELEKLDKKNDYDILLRKKYFKALKFENKRFRKVLADYRHYSLKEQIILPLQLIKLKPDLVHFPHFNVPILWWGRQIITIHDLIMHQSRGAGATTRQKPVYWLKHLVYRFLVWLAVKRAKKIIVPSQYWQKELAKKYRLPLRKIKVTYESVDKKWQAFKKTDGQSKKVLKKYKLKKPFIVYTGNLYPHKNVNNLLKALVEYHQIYAHQKKPNLFLTVVCARSVFYQRFLEKVKKMGLKNFVNLAGFVSDEDLPFIYSQAEAFVLPTLIEGFGLPGLEAMSTGCPVLASGIPVLKEVYGKAALYFDPYDEKDIARKIKEIIENSKQKNRLIKAGFNQIKKYSWQKMAQETMTLYEEVLFNSQGGNFAKK